MIVGARTVIKVIFILGTKRRLFDLFSSVRIGKATPWVLHKIPLPYFHSPNVEGIYIKMLVPCVLLDRRGPSSFSNKAGTFVGNLKNCPQILGERSSSFTVCATHNPGRVQNSFFLATTTISGEKLRLLYQDTVHMEISVPLRKIINLQSLLMDDISQVRITPRALARIAGKNYFYGPRTRPPLQVIHPANVPPNRTRTSLGYPFHPRWYHPFRVNFFGEMNLEKNNGFQIETDNTSSLQYCDTHASASAYGGYLLTRFGNDIAHGKFTTAEIDTSSTCRELLGVRNILTSFGANLRGETISLFSSHRQQKIFRSFHQGIS